MHEMAIRVSGIGGYSRDDVLFASQRLRQSQRRQAQDARHQDEGEQGADQHAADDDGREAAINLGADAGHDHQRQHAEDARQRAQVDRAGTNAHGIRDGRAAIEPFAQAFTRLHDQQDGVIDDETEQDQEADHGQQVHGLDREQV